MIPDFNFIGFDPDEDIKNKAYLAAERLLDIVPYGSMAVALLQKDEISYRCAIEIYSKHGPFTARASDTTPDAALESVVRTLSKKLVRWKERRLHLERKKAPRHSMSLA